MAFLDNDDFFARLADLFDTQKGKRNGAIYLSQKTLAFDENEKTITTGPVKLPSQTRESIIIRASNGKSKGLRKDKVRLSTTVNSDALESFYVRYAETCKAGMVLLKPRDKSKKKAKAKKKKAATAVAAP